MARLVYKKLNASTIVENIVALVIITISFGIGMTVFSGIAYPVLGTKKERARLLLNASINEYSKDPVKGIYTTQAEDINIIIDIAVDSLNTQLMRINGTATAGDKTIATKKILVIKYSK